MSYSNPKIYLQDPLAFANSFKKAFQSSYQNVEDHIAKVRTQVEQKNKALKQTGEDLQDAIDKSKNLAGTWSNKLAEAGSFWMRDNRAFEKRNEEGGALTNVASARALGGSSAAGMQKAEGSFKGVATQLNQISEFLVDTRKYKDVDKSNKDYADIQMIMDYAKSNPESLTVEQYGDDFSAYITYPNPNGELTGENGQKYSTIPTDVLGAKLTTLQSREDFDKQFDGAIDKFKTTIKSEIDKDREEAVKENKDLFIDGIQRTRERTGPMLRRMQLSEKARQNTTGGPGFFEKTFANLGDNVPFDFEPNVEVYGNTQKELFSKTRIGKAIVDNIDNAKDKETLEPYLRAILDLPLSDKRMDGYISQLTKEDILSASEVDELYEALGEYQFQVVKEVVDLDVIASGVDSESVLIKRTKQTGSTATSSKKTKEYNSERAGIILREGFSSAVKAGKSWGGVGTGTGFTSGQFRVGGKGTPKQIVGTSYNSSTGELSIHYPSGTAAGGIRNTEKVDYDTKDPYKMQDMYRDLGDVGNKNFNKEMLKQFEGGDYSSLNTNGMIKWVDWLTKQGKKDEMIDYLSDNMELTKQWGHWLRFYNNNKIAIDKKMIDKARANK